MSTIIGAVADTSIEHGILIDLVIPTEVYIENASTAMGIVTLTFTNPGFVPFESGTTITVAGITPDSYNGTYIVIDCTSTQCTAFGSGSGTYVEGGQAKGSDRRWYISNCYNPIRYNGKDYLALGGFLEISNLQQDLSPTNNEISVSLSAIPPEYIENIIGQPIKGGAIRVYRVFFDPATKLIKKVDGVLQVFRRYSGVITNWGINEDIQDGNSGGVEITYTIGIQCSSILGVLENRIAGRRTNNNSYQQRWYEKNITDAITSDLSFSRIEQLKNASFDFGKPYKK